MPVMPRSNKKATKIAFALLGTPANMRKMTRKQRKRQKMLQRAATRLAR